ncbi:hypothetical protein BJP34_35750 (plasmid) [Moorena producens PAL-8-15-08-1]|uniref:Uncharacterized protein n=1 Tax=Moorena producens PAL-8-15-08-1 TaxID=1458985 RepID=A0A1D8U4W7_9CYAN|nr:hypothetical protein [Moorena producens]AOX04736.1 hypothetical protein BJP34_35750 [Moorena producens PAL-8-15-08-1]
MKGFKNFIEKQLRDEEFKDFIKEQALKQIINQIINRVLATLMGIPPMAVAFGRMWSQIFGGYFDDPDYQRMAAENKRKGLLDPHSEASRRVKTGEYW